MKIIISNSKRYLYSIFTSVFATTLSIGLICYMIYYIGTEGMDVVSNGVAGNQSNIPIYKVDTNEKKMSISFNCAWGNDDIIQILDTLQKYNIKTTFFCVGDYVQRYPEVIKLMLSKGHEVASHGFTHTKYTTIESGRVRKEVQDFNKVMAGIVGSETWKGKNLIRTPYGDWSEAVVKTLNEEGLKTIQWSIDSLDWKTDATKESINNRVVTKLDSGAIILLHSGTKCTADSLDNMLNTIITQGYEVVPVGDLLIKEPYTVNNDGVQKKVMIYLERNILKFNNLNIIHKKN